MEHFISEAKTFATQKSRELLAIDARNLNAEQLDKTLYELSELIHLCRTSYYQENIPLVSDITYDKLQNMQYDIFSILAKTNQ